ncbi:uncharacterized protein LOC110280467 [Arachis duranensis]|uniref:Uncharacterized protein LOC110280467 n=1 Tax=Arachis duranensis TaxID=130453 RepID=A0A6P5NKS4_ARADU|nr:uncharacterized protein LOC110280467 [Arachis duranensis]
MNASSVAMVLKIGADRPVQLEKSETGDLTGPAFIATHSHQGHQGHHSRARDHHRPSPPPRRHPQPSTATATTTGRARLLVATHNHRQQQRPPPAEPASSSPPTTIDASNMIKTADTLFKLFAEVIEWVGSSNIVHVVTDNATNYVSAGKLIHEKYPNIFWSPCAAHCINLILKDIASLPHIDDLASRASKVTVFVYNHMIFLSWLRKRKEWKEIVRPGVTRFATIFITLKSIYDHKEDLQSLVIDKYFTSHKLSKSVNGKMVSSIILDSKFWEDCFTTVMLVGPLIKLLRLVNADEKPSLGIIYVLVDADEKPSLGIVYAGMQRAKINIKTMFRNRKSAYTPYTSILKMRWDKHLKRDLHAAAYFLNPDYFYSEGFVEKANILRSLLDLFDIETLCDDLVAAMQEIQLYRDRKGSFGRESALKAIKRLEPGEWWRLHGGSAPNLQKMAIRLLLHPAARGTGASLNKSIQREGTN